MLLKNISMETTGRATSSSVTSHPFQTRICSRCDARDTCLIQSQYRNTGDPSLLLNHQYTYQEGEFIFHAGDTADAIYIVSSGSVKYGFVMQDGTEQVNNFFLSGDILGLESIGLQDHVSSAVALEKTTICRLAVSTLEKQLPGGMLLKTVSRYLVHQYNMKLMLASKESDARLACFLLHISKHLDTIGDAGDVFYLTMSRQDIANYLGMALETVSRTLRRFQDDGLIEVTRRTICIEDFTGLENAAGPQLLF